MRALILTDLHHGHSISEYFLSYELKLFDWFESVKNEYRIDTIINLGDTHDKQMSVNPKVANLFRDKHKQLSIGIDNYYVLAGNHDCYYKTSNTITTLPLFFKEANQILIETKPLKIGTMCFIPWISPDNIEEIKKFVNENNRPENTLFCHIEASGFRNGAITTKHDQLYISEMDKYKAVYSGHYHAKQKKGNLTFLGNCFQKTFGELEHKFLHVLIDDELIPIINQNDIFLRRNIPEGLTTEEIENNVKDFKDKIVQLYIPSSDFDYISKVEMMIEKYRPYEMTLKTKNIIDDTSDVEIDNSTEDELNEMFLNQMTYPNEKTKNDFQEKFEFYWKKAEK